MKFGLVSYNDPGRMVDVYTSKINIEPTNHLIEKEKHLNQTSMTLGSILIFKGVNLHWKKKTFERLLKWHKTFGFDTTNHSLGWFAPSCQGWAKKASQKLRAHNYNSIDGRG